jgi:hypothetical protein
MKRLILATVMVCSTSVMSVMTLGAQGPGGRRPGPGPMPGPGAMGGGGPIDDPAQFLLSQTGELKLTDAQVTRLAAIARRSADRRRALRAQMDSLRSQRVGGERPDSAARERMRQRFEQMRPDMERLRDQAQADRRDAIAVLTPDQQAQAWERIARSGRGAGNAGFRGRTGARRMGMRGGAMPGMPGGRLRGQGCPGRGAVPCR